MCPPCFGTRGPPRPSGSRAAGRRRPFRFRAPSTSGTGSPLQRQASLTGKPSAARRSGDAFFLQRDRNGGVRIGYHEQSSVPKGSYPEKVFGSMIEYGMTAQRPRNGPLCESECVDFLGNTPPVPGIRARGRGRRFAPQSVAARRRFDARAARRREATRRPYWGCTQCNARGEILRPMHGERQRRRVDKHSPANQERECGARR